MKKFLPLFFVFITEAVLAQNRGGDVVYLKNGSVIKGTIIKNLSDSTIAITTQDGNLFVFNNREVARTLINNAASSNNAAHSTHINNLWIGVNVEPQFQNIFKSPKEARTLSLQYNENRQLPGSGGAQLGIKLYYLPWGIAGFETGLQYHFYQTREIFSQFYYGTSEFYYPHNQFHSLEVPLVIDIHGPGRRVRFYSSDGLSVGITLRANHSQSYYTSGYTYKDSTFVTHADSTTAVYCTILASAGVQISLVPNMLLNLTAAFRLSAGGILGATNPTYVPNNYPFFPYSIGLNVEILFHAPAGIKNMKDNFLRQPESINPEEAQQKNIAIARAKHDTWNDCFMILFNGDTIRGKVQRSEDYSVTGGLFSKDRVLFAHPDESEEKIGPGQFNELYIPKEDSGYRKYITIAGEEIGTQKIYRVVIDGKCQLLSNKIIGSQEPLSMPESVEKFYVYYKDTLTPVNFNKKQDFINKFKVLFAECTALTDKIENHFNQLGSTGNVIREFNKCIGSRY